MSAIAWTRGAVDCHRHDGRRPDCSDLCLCRDQMHSHDTFVPVATYSAPVEKHNSLVMGSPRANAIQRVLCSCLCVNDVSWRCFATLAMSLASSVVVCSTRILRYTENLRERSFLKLCIRNDEHTPLVVFRSDTCCETVSIEGYCRLCTSTVIFFFSVRTQDINRKVGSRPLSRSVVVSKEEGGRRALTVSRHMVGRFGLTD